MASRRVFRLASLVLLFAAAPATAVPLNGTYTVGTGKDYANFTAAAAAVVAQGVSGPVTFVVDPGTYDETLHLTAIAGSSSTNRVTFVPVTSTNVTLRNPAPESHAVWLDGASHVVFDQLYILSAPPDGIGSASLIELNGVAVDIHLLNCIVQNTGGNRALLSASSGTLDGLELRGNNFVSGSAAVSLTGVSVPNLTISNNLIAPGPVTLTNVAAPGMRIEANSLRGDYGLRATGMTGTGGVVANNFIQADLVGMDLDFTAGPVALTVAYNSLRDTTVAGTAIRLAGSQAGAVTLRNNVLYCSGGGTPLTAVSTVVASSDYNDLYTTGTRLALWDGFDIASLPELRGVSGGEYNSVSVDPEFVSTQLQAIDLHSTSATLDGSGTMVAAVTDDIDGEPRDPATPDIGADEFQVVPGSSFLLRWGGYGSGEGQFGGYSAGAGVDRFGNVYVSDHLNNFRIQKFSSSGGFILQWGRLGTADGEFGGAGAFGPFGVAVHDDRVYVADMGNQRVQVFTLDGVFVRKFGGPGPPPSNFDIPTGVAVDDSGNVYVSDLAGQVRKFDPLGTFVWRYPRIGFPDPELNGAMQVAVAPGGMLYVAEINGNEVTQLTTDGQFVTSWGGAGPLAGQFNAPRGVAVGPGGLVYVADTENGRVQRFSPSGTFLDQWSVNKPAYVAFNADGDVYLPLYIPTPRVEKFGALPAPWQANGQQASGPAADLTAPQAIPDNVGGSLITWQQSGGALAGPESTLGPGGARVKVIRINEGGLTAGGWSAAGVSLSSLSGAQYSPSSVMDIHNGAVVAWTDERSGTPNLYVQHVTADGVVDPAWTTNGVLLCTAAGARGNVATVSDGVGGVIAVWEDQRGADVDLFAARILPDGSRAPGWPAGGVAVCTATGDQTAPAIIADGIGGVLVAWQDERGGVGKTYLQRLTAAGVVAAGWPANGLPVAATSGLQERATLVTDAQSGAIVVWTDHGGADADLYARRVLADGTFDPSWSAGGDPLCVAPGDPAGVRASEDGEGGAFVAWQDPRNVGVTGVDIYALRIDTAGNPATGWPANGRALCSATGDQVTPALVIDQRDGAVVSWHDQRGGADDIYGIGVRANGTIDPRWPANGRVLCNAVGAQLEPTITTDAAGGALVAWTDARNPGERIFAQHVIPGGDPVTTGVADAPTRPALELMPVRPNPATGPMTIDFQLPIAAPAEVRVYDVNGRLVRELLPKSVVAAGPHRLQWDGRNGAGRKVPAGLYLVRLSAADRRIARKVTWLQ